MGRTLLMIIVPLLLLQIGLSVLIVQRYYGRVTEQLSMAVIHDIEFLESRAENKQNFENGLRAFSYRPYDTAPEEAKNLGVFDLSGRNIHRNFQNAFGDDVEIRELNDRDMVIQLPTQFGSLWLVIARDKLAPINPHQILINTFAFLLASLFFVLLFLRNQVRSIRRLSKAAEAFGRGESIAYSPTGADEIRLAGQNFLKMRERILRQRKQRNLMLSGISHDLRTPLTRFRLEIDMLDDPKTKAAMLRDVEDMETLINSFLSYAQGDAMEEVVNTNLPQFLKHTLEGEKEVIIQSLDDVYVRIRPELMRRAIINIVENAKRFSQNIEISTDTTSSHVQIIIDDDGPGIPPEERAEALLAFHSVDRSRNQDKGAHAGLGLAIAADAMRINNGKIELTNSPQNGLRVILSLPVSQRD